MLNAFTFSTFDKNSDVSCFDDGHNSGWWFNSDCEEISNLNGQYLEQEAVSNTDWHGILWNDGTGYNSEQRDSMKISPTFSN